MKTIQAHETRAVVEADQSIRLSDLPFHPGQQVEIIVLERDEPIPANKDRYPLRGKKPYHFDDPFSPVAVEDWELLK
jgi:hypothetical protein